ncbi:MAG: cupin domain-containing protein [Solirubrobacteraceae bacterium]
MSLIKKVAPLAVAAGLGAGTMAVAQSGGDPVRENLAAQANPKGAKGRTLALARVTIPAGAVLALHHHTGTQIARVTQGTLTYTVKSGSVSVHTGQAGEDTIVRKISAGQTGPIKAGQWIVEEPSVVHGSSNRGTKKVVIYLSTLLPNGDPPSVPNR